jgi:hypothetical protein
MDIPLYGICFPDILDKVATYLDVPDIAALARTNTHFAQYAKDTDLIYRHVAITHPPKRRTRGDPIHKFLTSLERSPSNAETITSLSIRHSFSECFSSDEVTYVERINAICALCPNIMSLSLHLNNLSSGCYVNPASNFPEGATRAYYCHAFGFTDVMTQTAPTVQDMLTGLGGLRSLDWCLRCAPSGGSAEWEASHLREDLETINEQCPNLEHLGLLDYHDGQIVDAVINGVKSEIFTLDGENAFSGLFPHLTDVTFHISQERDAEKVVSASVMTMILGNQRGIASSIVPWCQAKSSQLLVVEDIILVLRIGQLLREQLGLEPDELNTLWTQYIRWDPTFEVSVSSNNIAQLDLVNIISEQTKSINIILRAHDLTPRQFRNLHLPRQTRSLAILTNCIPLSSIRHLIAPLKLHSLTVDYEHNGKDGTEEKVMMNQSRAHSTDAFVVEWASEPIMAFNLAIWGDMTSTDYGDNLFEAVVGRAIARTSWDSRMLLESSTRTLFEKGTTLRKVDIIASYPLYRLEESSPHLFKT